MANSKKLDALQEFHFANQKARARRAYKLGIDQNLQERDLAKQQHDWQSDDLVRDFSRARESFGGQWSRRGMMNSGLYRHKLGQFQDDKQTQLGRAATGWNLQKKGFGLVDSQLESIRNDTLSDLEKQKQALLTVKSATINNAIPY